jgi:DNA invertase Pin-like site-specific DNA recombinase
MLVLPLEMGGWMQTMMVNRVRRSAEGDLTTRAIIWAAVSTVLQAHEDKDSLPVQEAQARALCESNGWDIAAVLRVPGHSRHYIDVHECARDMNTQGIDAFSRLLDLWDNHAFDVLICRDGSRFARTQALHSYVVERTIQNGAQIFSFADGFIDERNFRMFISMSGYKSASDVDQLIQRRRMGMDKLARMGFPTGPSPIISHRVIRDEKTHRRIAVEVIEDHRRMWDDLAQLILAGTPWHRVERAMADRGHVRPENGEKFPPLYFWRLLHHPYFWGNNGVKFDKKHGLWAFDPDEPCPEGVTMYYNTHTPVYTGQLAADIKAHLRWRHEEVVGSVQPDRTFWWTGLFVCDECGYKCATSIQNSRWFYIRCNGRSKMAYDYDRVQCSQSRSLRADTAQKFIEGWLRDLIAFDNLDVALSDDTDSAQADRQRMNQLTEEIQAAERKLSTLILQKADIQDLTVQQEYTRLIEQRAEHIKTLRSELRSTEARLNIEHISDSRQRTFEQLKEMTVEKFWNLPTAQQNRMLHIIVGRWRFRMRDGLVVGRQMYYRGHRG